MTKRTRKSLRALRLRYSAGEDLAALASEAGLSVGTLRWWWRKTGLNEEIVGRYRMRRRWKRSTLRSLRERYVAGESVESLAEETGCGVKALTAAWTQHGIARELPLPGLRRADWTMGQLRRLAQRWRAGETLASLAREINVNVETLSSALVRTGLKTPEAAALRRAEIRSRREGEIVRKAYVLRRDTTLSWDKIAEKVGWPGLGSSLGTKVTRWCEREEMPRPPRRSRTGRAIE